MKKEVSWKADSFKTGLVGGAVYRLILSFRLVRSLPSFQKGLPAYRLPAGRQGQAGALLLPTVGALGTGMTHF